MPLRLFLFNIHAHALIFIVCIMNALYVPFYAIIYLLVTVECCTPILTLLLDLWINNFNYGTPGPIPASCIPSPPCSPQRQTASTPFSRQVSV